MRNKNDIIILGNTHNVNSFKWLSTKAGNKFAEKPKKSNLKSVAIFKVRERFECSIEVLEQRTC